MWLLPLAKSKMRTIADSQKPLDARGGDWFADSSPADLVYVNLKNEVSLPMHWSLKDQYDFDEVMLNTVCVIPTASKMNISWLQSSKINMVWLHPNGSISFSWSDYWSLFKVMCLITVKPTIFIITNTGYFKVYGIFLSHISCFPS